MDQVQTSRHTRGTFCTSSELYVWLLSHFHHVRKAGSLIKSHPVTVLPPFSTGGVVWRIRASDTRLVCAAGSRNGTEDTKLLVLDFDLDDKRKETD